MSELRFFTFFSKDYVPKAELLHESLLRFESPLSIQLCYLDKESHQFAKTVITDSIFSFSDVLGDNALLESALQGRLGAARIFSAVPSMIKNAISKVPENSLLIYLDADTLAFGSFDPVLKAMEGSSVGLFPHDFIRPLNLLFNRFGKYNAGAIVVRNDERGRSFLDEWENLCIGWCEDRVSGRNYSNQAYLTHLFEANPTGIAVLSDTGGNVAPWNCGAFNTSVQGTEVKHKGRSIVFFHFHGIDFSEGHWTIGHLRYLRFLLRSQIDAIYGRYISQLERAHRKHNVPIGKSERFSQGGSFTILNSLLALTSVIIGQRSQRQT